MKKKALSPEEHERILNQMAQLIDPELSPETNICNILAFLKDELQLFWIGLYECRKDKLYLGIYQGAPACTKIEYGKGVCGSVGSDGNARIIDDVNQLDNYIACHPETQSEIVIPGLKDGKVAFVLDIDSIRTGYFDESMIPFFEQVSGRISKLI